MYNISTGTSDTGPQLEALFGEWLFSGLASEPVSCLLIFSYVSWYMMLLSVWMESIGSTDLPGHDGHSETIDQNGWFLKLLLSVILP